MSEEACLMIARSDTDSDIYYATHFLAGDPFICITHEGKTYLATGMLEFGRAKRQARVDEVLSESDARSADGLAGVAANILDRLGVKRLFVPENFGYAMGKMLEAKGFALSYKLGPFIDARTRKTAEEVGWIEEAQRATGRAIIKAMEILRRSRVEGDRMYNGEALLTSEHLRATIDGALDEEGYDANETIVAGGAQAVDPHEGGSGPLAPHAAIVMDVFPRSVKTRYFADMTRTVCVGEPPAELARMYECVRKAQEIGISMVRPGAKGRDIQIATEQFFEKEGFGRREVNGKMEGFIHGVGHSLGLDVHEKPAIRHSDDELEEGNVVTVEPGLYFSHIGGVRIEDTVVVTSDGCRVLADTPKEFQIL